MGSRICAALILIGGWTLSAAAQSVQIRKVHAVGFEANVSVRNAVRIGQWFPVLIELDALGTVPYQVELRCEGADLDGDRVAFVERPVTVTPGAGGKRVWCYTVTNGRRNSFTIDVLGADGALITRSELLLVEPIGPDHQLILDISDAKLDLSSIDSGANRYYEDDWGQRRFYRGVCTARLEARNLPDRWFGLESADVIIWDDPDPERLSPAQIDALVEWVRNGGQLVIGIGAAWPKLEKSRLAEILPLKGAGPLAEVTYLERYFAKYVRGMRDSFESPVLCCTAGLASGAVATLREQDINLIALRLVGSGRVITTAARLRDLMGVARRRVEFLHAVLDLNENTEAFKEAETKLMMPTRPAMFESIMRPIEFRGQATVLVGLAFLFVGAYILISVFVSWMWLKRQSLTQISWTVFAAFAVIASAVSLSAVRLVRGLGDSIHTFSFVDLESGSTEARSHVYVGYKSPNKKDVDLGIDSDSGYLRALAPGYQGGVEYATPDRYTAEVLSGVLLETPMRATLKQFEGFWQGTLDGPLSGRLSATRANGTLMPQSWIKNDLGVDISGGWLLYIDPRLEDDAGGVPVRVAGLDQRSTGPYRGSETVPAAVNVLAVAVPAIKNSERIAEIGREMYEPYFANHGRWEGLQGRKPEAEPLLDSLWHIQTGNWAGAFSAISLADDVPSAAFFCSTRDLYLHTGAPARQGANFDSARVPITTRGLVDQDITHWLSGGRSRGTAVLLLYSEAPGPAAVTRNGRPLRASRGSALYRVRIPIRYTGRPPASGL